MGRHTDALHAELEAVAIRREMAQTDPGRYGLDLAQALTSLAGTLSALDRDSEAEQVHAEAKRWRNTSRGVPNAPLP
jgi:hypothetical protein